MSRRKQNFLQKDFSVEFTHASVTSDQTDDLWSVPAGYSGAVIDRVLYVNPTGLATDDTNYVIVKILNVAKVAASWSTKTTGGNGAFVAGTQVAPALSATVTDLAMAVGDKLKLFLDATGSPTVPAGKIRIEGRLL